MNKPTPKNLNDRVSYAQKKIKTAYVFGGLSIAFILLSFLFFGSAIAQLFAPIRDSVDSNLNIISLNAITSEINLHSEFKDLIASMDQKQNTNFITTILPYFTFLAVIVLIITILKNLFFLIRAVICYPYEKIKWEKCYNYYLRNSNKNKNAKKSVIFTIICIAVICLVLTIFTILLLNSFDWAFRVQKSYLSDSEITLLQYYTHNVAMQPYQLHDYFDSIKTCIFIGHICNILIFLFKTEYSVLVDIDIEKDAFL